MTGAVATVGRHDERMAGRWRDLARLQGGLVARRQLNALGVDWGQVRNQLRAERWAERTSVVVSTFTGELTWEQRVWLAVLHAGGDALVCGLTLLEWQGLKNWHRDEVSVLVPGDAHLDPVDGVRFVRTRRDVRGWRDTRLELPACRVEPAALLFAGYDRSARTAQGLLAAVVQQRLASPQGLAHELEQMRPLRRASSFRAALADIAGGAQSMAELDVARVCRRFGLPSPRRQTGRRDASGRRRFTDCEWVLPDGTVLVLEVDGGFHINVENYTDDVQRHRGLTADRRIVVRCTTYEVRHEPVGLMRDLIALGVQRAA